MVAASPVDGYEPGMIISEDPPVISDHDGESHFNIDMALFSNDGANKVSILDAQRKEIQGWREKQVFDTCTTERLENFSAKEPSS